jgi:hypothetical protein
MVCHDPCSNVGQVKLGLTLSRRLSQHTSFRQEIQFLRDSPLDSDSVCNQTESRWITCLGRCVLRHTFADRNPGGAGTAAKRILLIEDEPASADLLAVVRLGSRSGGL